MGDITRVAVATSDGKNVNVHFGHALHYQIYEMGGSLADAGWHLVNEVDITFAQEKEDTICAGKDLSNILQAAECLTGCQYVLVEKIGPRPHKVLLSRGIECLETDGPIQEALQQIQTFLEGRGGWK